MREIIIELINRFGYVGVALLIAIENLFPPIPSEVILTFAGFLTTRSQMSLWGTVAASTAGSMAGAAVLYTIGRVLPVHKLDLLINGKVGKALRFKPGDIHRAKGWFLRHGKRTVFFCRFIPVVRSLISIPAGMARMNIAPFLLISTLGTALWNLALVYLGALAGEAWENVAHYVDAYSLALYVAGGMAIAAFIAVYACKRFRGKTDAKEKGQGAGERQG